MQVVFREVLRLVCFAALRLLVQAELDKVGVQASKSLWNVCDQAFGNERVEYALQRCEPFSEDGETAARTCS